MEGRCIEKKITLEYPKHRFTPEDLLHFIESTGFTEAWSKLGLDDEDDLTSLQLCIMAHPQGDAQIRGAGGLRKHRHAFGDWGIKKPDVTAYYTYFEDYGIVYLACLDRQAEDVTFSRSEKAAIRDSIAEVGKELARVRTIQ